MLNIDSEKSFLFIHVPKCAGTSIESFFGYDYDNNSYFENKLDVGHPKHMTLSVYSEVLSKKVLDGLFKFAFIRNPFDLYVSIYNYSLHSKGVYWNGKNDYEYKKNISFDNFIISTYNNRLKVNKHRLDASLTSFSDYIDSDITKLDFIGRFENLQGDFDYVCEQLGIENSKLPFDNKSKVKKKDYKDYYTNQTKDMIYDMFGNDLKKYNYDF